MIQEAILFKAKNGQEFEIRSPLINEAQLSLELMIETAAHSPYILSTPEAFKKRTVENQVKWFQDSASSDSAIIISMFYKNQIIGFCDARSYTDIKRKHRATLGMLIHQNYRGLGLGMKLMEVLIAKIKQFAGIKIIELDVMTNNIPALKMYEKIGFKKGGIFPNAFILPSGEVSDNLTMLLEL